MTLTIILLGIFACICNVFMDEIQFHWDRLFGLIFPAGSKAEKWFNPAISWENKYIFQSRFLSFLLSTVFVFVTDFWHLLKFLFLSSAYLIVLFLINSNGAFWEYVLGIFLLHLAWGFVFELTNGVLGAISDFKRLKNK